MSGVCIEVVVGPSDPNMLVLVLWWAGMGRGIPCLLV